MHIHQTEMISEQRIEVWGSSGREISPKYQLKITSLSLFSFFLPLSVKSKMISGFIMKNARLTLSLKKHTAHDEITTRIVYQGQRKTWGDITITVKKFFD